MMNQGFLPLCRKEMLERGWDRADFVYVTGRCVCGSPFFRAGYYQPHAGGTWLPGVPDLPAGLERSGEHCRVWGAEAWVSGVSRQYGFPWSTITPSPKSGRRPGCLHTGRGDGEAAGLCRSSLWQPDPPARTSIRP